MQHTPEEVVLPSHLMHEVLHTDRLQRSRVLTNQQHAFPRAQGSRNGALAQAALHLCGAQFRSPDRPLPGNRRTTPRFLSTGGDGSADPITVRDVALEIAFKKSAGALGADFLGQIRNRL